MTKRIVKSPDVRRLEIIKTAEQLFNNQGYAKTPVEAIINAANIAKGTFYYYFKTKEEVLRAVVEQVGNDIEAFFVTIVDNPHLNAVEKLKQMITGPTKKAKTDTAIMATLHKPENRALQEQLNIRTVQSIAPLFAQVFAQGYQEGIFKKIVSLESIQLILAGSEFVLSSGLFDLTKQKQIAYLKSIQDLLGLLCDTKPGVFSFITDSE